MFHGSELALLFGPVPAAVEDDFANQMLDFYINFVNHLNPGGESIDARRDFSVSQVIPSLAPWPQFMAKSKVLLQLKRGNVTVIPDGASPVSVHFLFDSKYRR